jgi:YVTN family beta-propeller protein
MPASTSPVTYDSGGVISQIDVGSSPENVAYDNGNGDIYVTVVNLNNVSVISESTDSVIANVPVGSVPTALAYDSGNGDVYVTNSNSNSVSVISGATNTVMAIVPVGSSPNAVVYDSANGDLYVANSYANNVSVISGATNTVIATIPVGTYPFGGAYDGGNGNIYVANFYTNNVSVISGVTNTVVANIKVGVNPVGVAYDGGNGYVYVANEQSFNVSVISGVTNTVVATTPVGLFPRGVGYDSGNGDLYVANFDSDNVTVISGVTNSVVATLPVGAAPIGVGYDSGNGEVYVTDSGSNFVSVISTLLEVQSMVPELRALAVTGVQSITVGVGTSPSCVAFDRDNGDIYVTDTGTNNMSVISGVTNMVVASIPVGTSPDGVAYDSGDADIYVADTGSNEVSVISGATNTVVATIPVGVAPVGVVYDRGNGDVYVVNAGANSVSVISEATNAVVATVPVGANPLGGTYDTGNGNIYVVNSVSSTVSVISEATNAVVATIPVGANPDGAAYDSGNGYVYVSNSNSNDVSVISGVTNSVIATVPVGSSPQYVAYDSGNGDVYVANSNSQNLSVISGVTRTVVATVTVGRTPIGVAYDNGNGDIYVVSNYAAALDVIPTLSAPIQFPPSSLDVGQSILFSAPLLGQGAGGDQLTVSLSPPTGMSCSVDPLGHTLISGACLATSVGTYTVTFTVQDVLGTTVSTSIDVTVYPDPAANAPLLTPSSVDWGQVATLSVSPTGGTGTFSYVWTGLPTECPSADRSSITCQPSSSTGSFPVGVSVTDSNNFTVVAPTTTLRIYADPTVASFTGTASSVDVGQTDVFSVAMSGGTGTFSYSWTGLPPGCNTVDTARLSCTPTSTVGNPFTVGVTARDSNGVSAPSSGFSLAVLADPTLSQPTSTLAAADVGMGVTFTSTASFGSGGYSASPLNLAAGLGCGAESVTGTSVQVVCTPSAAGTYAVSLAVADSNGVVATSTTTPFTVYTDPIVGISPGTPASADVGETVTFSSTVSGGSGGDVYAWSVSSANLGCGATNLPTLTCTPTSATGSPFTVSVSVTDSNGKTTPSPVLPYTVDPALGLGLTVSLPPARPFMDVGQTVVFTASATAGAGTYTFSWSGVGPFDGCVSAWSGGTGWLNCTPSASAGGTSFSAAVTVVDGNGVSKSVGSFPVVVSPDPTVSTPVASRTSLDVGQTVVLTTTATPGSGSDHFVWSGLPIGCSTANTTSITCKPTAPSNGSMISVTVTDSNGGSQVSGPVLVTVSAPPTLGSLAWSPGAIDLGQSTTLTATGTSGSGGLTFTWSGLPSGCSGLNVWILSCIPGHTGSSVPALTITDSNGGNATLSGSTLTVFADPTITTPAVSRNLLDDGQTTTLSALASVATGTPTYAWMGLPGGCTGTRTSTVSCTPPTGTAGTYTVTVSVTDGNGMNVSSSPVQITVSAALGTPGVSATVTALDVGMGVTFTVTIAGGASPYAYVWSGLPSGCASVDGPSLSCAPSRSGTYTVSVSLTDGNGAVRISAGIALDVSAAPLAGTLTVSKSSLDLGTSTNLSVSPVAGTASFGVVWHGLPPGCSSANATTLACIPNAPGTYSVWVTVTDSNGESVTGSPLTITVFPALGTATLTASVTALDLGESFSVAAGISGGSGAYTYAWSGLPPGCLGADTGTLTCVPTAAGNRTLSVTATDSTGSTASASVSVTVNPALRVTLATSPVSATGPTTLTFTASVSGGTGIVVYAWYLNGSLLSGKASPSLTLPGANPGTYMVSVEVTDGTGATATSLPASVVVSPNATSGPGASPTSVTTSPTWVDYLLVVLVAILVLIGIALLLQLWSRKGGGSSSVVSSTQTSLSPGVHQESPGGTVLPRPAPAPTSPAPGTPGEP